MSGAISAPPATGDGLIVSKLVSNLDPIYCFRAFLKLTSGINSLRSGFLIKRL